MLHHQGGSLVCREHELTYVNHLSWEEQRLLPSLIISKPKVERRVSFIVLMKEGVPS
jgi:hypothetical protein